MADHGLNGTYTHLCFPNPNPAEQKSDMSIKIELSTELIMKLGNNAYDGTEIDDAVDHITRFLQIIDLAKTPDVNIEQLCVLTFRYSMTGKAHQWWEKGYDNDTLDYDEESSDNESNNGDHHPFFDHHQNDNNKGDENNQKERSDHFNRPENFVQNDAPQSYNNKTNKGMCRMDKFEVIKYSVGDNEEFLGVRALKHNSWAKTVNEVSSIYLDIFHKKDKGWTVTRTK
ncbi:hypothetical protein Tco_0163504 [Tanacetum coccineum]